MPQTSESSKRKVANGARPLGWRIVEMQGALEFGQASITHHRFCSLKAALRSALPFEMKILICPDKFKGTLSAEAAAEAIARGWRKVRPHDSLQLLPISDGGDGFGPLISRHLSAETQTIKTLDAAHRPRIAKWWWEARTKTAVIESAEVIGLALLPP